MTDTRLNNRNLFINGVADTFRRNSTKEAVVVGDKRISFAELEAMAASVASEMNAMVSETDEDTRIGVCMHKCEWLMPSVLAIVMSDCTYVPIDPDTPVSRIKDIIEDCHLQLVITDHETAPMFQDIPHIDATMLKNDSSLFTNAVANSSVKNSTAYIIYTSGTTGNPKGIPITYANLMSFLDACSSPDVFDINGDGRLLLFASINFDMSIPPIFGTLYYGATMVMATDQERMNPSLLCDLMAREHVTYAGLPPTLLGQLPTCDFPSLHVLLSAGEALAQPAANRAMGHGYRLVNGYGPTESTVIATFRDVIPDVPSRCIGKPLKGVVTHIVDENMQEVADGESGELMLGGDQLFSGYLNRPELNSQAIVKNPFAATASVAPVLYHTGDIVRLLPSGDIDYLGRMDSQVKINGFRIELGDVKTHIEQCPNVEQSYVRVEYLGDEPIIAAYVKHKTPATGFNEEKRLLAEKLPSYMIPTWWIEVERFELNINGKVDKSKLRNTHLEAMTNASEPKTEAEATVASIVENCVGISNIGLDVDLVNELGLGSLLVMKCLVNFGIAGIGITASDFYRTPTIRQLARIHESKRFYWLNEPVKGKPVLVVISGYTSFSFLYDIWAQRLKDTYNIYVVESYQDNCNCNRTADMIVDEYIDVLSPVAEEYGIDVMTGFCLGGELALYAGYKLERAGKAKPIVVVMDGETHRDASPEKNAPARFRVLSDEINDIRVKQDLLLMGSFPDFHYDGPLKIIRSRKFTGSVIADIFDTSVITPEQDYWEEHTFKTSETQWKEYYPDSEVIYHETDHSAFLIDEENSIRPLELYFRKLAEEIGRK